MSERKSASEVVEKMGVHQLRTFAMIAAGYISGTEWFRGRHPDEAFFYIYDAVVKELNKDLEDKAK